MNYLIKNDIFIPQWKRCHRKPSDYKTESFSRARELAEKYTNIVVCVSGGLDSQVIIRSFLEQNITVNYVFFKAGDSNSNEYEYVKHIESRFNISVRVCDIDPDLNKEKIISIAQTADVHPNHALQRLFCEQLPLDCTIVQGGNDPWIVSKRSNDTHYLYGGYYDADISRIRAINSIPGRTGSIHLWHDSAPLFLSILNDSVFTDYLRCYKYYDNPYLQVNNKKLHDVHRYDYFIKPLLFAKWWKDDLEYYPKYRGYEKIQWIESTLNKDLKLYNLSELSTVKKIMSNEY